MVSLFPLSSVFKLFLFFSTFKWYNKYRVLVMEYDASYFCVIKVTFSIPLHLFLKILILLLPEVSPSLGRISIIHWVYWAVDLPQIAEPKS